MTGILNPYNPLQPVLNPEWFVGREDVFAFFRQHFVGTAHDHALALIGRRGLGKSSVLHQLQLDEQYVPCIVSLGALELPSESVLIAALVEEIQQTLEQAGASTYRLPDWPEEGDLRAWFQTEYLDVALSALRIRHLLLMLDDAHLLLDAMDRGTLPDDTLRYLGEVLAAYDRLDLVLALDSAYETRILNIDLLNDPTLHIRLAELSPDEAERLVRAPAANVLHYEDGVMERHSGVGRRASVSAAFDLPAAVSPLRGAQSQRADHRERSERGAGCGARSGRRDLRAIVGARHAQ